MPDEDKTNAEQKANAEEIERVDKTVPETRGNVWSEEEDPVDDQEGPPPMPN